MAATRRRARTPWAPLVRVAGRSMEPTLRAGDLVAVAPRPARARRGDLVVFRGAGGRLVKRVVGVAGDVIEMEAGRLRVNGRPCEGGGRVAGASVARWDVPAGHAFVVGDNRRGSDDSRTWERPFVPVRATRRAVPLVPGVLRSRSGPAPAASAPPRDPGSRTVKVPL